MGREGRRLRRNEIKSEPDIKEVRRNGVHLDGMNFSSFGNVEHEIDTGVGLHDTLLDQNDQQAAQNLIVHERGACTGNDDFWSSTQSDLDGNSCDGSLSDGEDEIQVE